MSVKERRLRKLEGELWQFIPGTNERYKISNYGRVKSFAYDALEGRILKCFIVNGYKMTQIRTETGKKKFYIHRLTAEVWIPKPTENHTFVSHIDRKLKNNHVSNLEWHTQESLTKKHKEIALKDNKGATRQRIVRNSKLTETDVKLLKSLLEKGVVQAKIAKLFCISEMQVTRIKRGENWGHI